MASKMIAKEAKASLLLFRSTILAASKPKAVPYHGELSQALRIPSQKPLAEGAVLRRYLYEDPSERHGIELGGVSDGRFWGLKSDVGSPAPRGKRVVEDEDEDEDEDEAEAEAEDDDDEDDDDDDDDVYDSDAIEDFDEDDCSEEEAEDDDDEYKKISN